MRWYDYPACILAADFISTGLLYGYPLGALIGVMIYASYEAIRKM